MPHHGKELESNVIELCYWYSLLCLEARPINKCHATCLVTVFRSERHVYMIESLTVQCSRKSQSTLAGFRDRVAVLEYLLQHRIIDFCHELLTQFFTLQIKLLYHVTKLANCEPKLLLTFLKNLPQIHIWHYLLYLTDSESFLLGWGGKDWDRD